MKFIQILCAFLLLTTTSCAQTPANRPHIDNPDFDKKISSLIRFSVPVMGVDELEKIKDEVVLLDARQKVEFDVSHIKDAQYIGYDDFEPSRLEGIEKNKKIVVYCSIGYRSEKIGEKLHNLGYNNVYNLYGSIFEWVNQGNEVVNKKGNPTKKVHTYNRKWSQWLKEGKAEKVW